MVHIAEGVIAAVLVRFGLFDVAVMTALLIVATAGSLFVKQFEVPPVERWMKVVGRDEHKNTLPGQGSLYLLTGFILSVVFFPLPVALAAILTATFGDSVNTLVGKYGFGTPNPLNPNKDLEGTLAGFVVAGFINMMLLGPFAGVVTAAAAMIVESLEIMIGRWELDDNVTVPLTVGVTEMAYQALVSFLPL